MDRIVIAAWVIGCAGCLSAGRPSAVLRPESAEACRELPHDCRRRVHLFFLNGLDPFDCADLSHARRTAVDLGFGKTYHGSLVHVPYFAMKIRRLSELDPEAKFVIVGHALGAESAFALAGLAALDDVPIDRLVLVEAPGWTIAARNKPANVGELVYVRSRSWLNFPNALGELHELETGWTWASPGHPLALERLAEQLHRSGRQIPFELPAPQAEEQPPELLPPPREWNFLEPTARLAPTARPFDPPVETVTTLKP